MAACCCGKLPRIVGTSQPVDRLPMRCGHPAAAAASQQPTRCPPQRIGRRARSRARWRRAKLHVRRNLPTAGGNPAAQAAALRGPLQGSCRVRFVPGGALTTQTPPIRRRCRGPARRRTATRRRVGRAGCLKVWGMGV
eukprot:359407-Chlamydomonas_euryale.AAC.2